MKKSTTKIHKTSDQSRFFWVESKDDKDMVLREWQLKAIWQGIAEADAGKLLPHEEAVKRLRKWGKQGS